MGYLVLRLWRLRLAEGPSSSEGSIKAAYPLTSGRPSLSGFCIRIWLSSANCSNHLKSMLPERACLWQSQPQEGDWSLKVGFIVAGTVTATFDCRLITASHTIASKSRGPEALADFVSDHGYGAIAGTKRHSAECNTVILATRSVRLADALKGIDWRGRILIDATNTHVDPAVDLSLAGVPRSRAALQGRTSSELIAEMAVAARLVKPISNMPMAPERGTIS
jgi:hypothetical protein